MPSQYLLMMLEQGWGQGGASSSEGPSLSTHTLGLTASLVSQFFYENFVENETRFSRKYQFESCKSHEYREKGKMRYIVKLVSHAICETHEQAKT
jgi:hypothetical protein